MDLNHKTILVTGAAGFIGANLVLQLLKNTKGTTIVGLDNLNDYYDVAIKEFRLEQIAIEEKKAEEKGNRWVFVKGSIADSVLVQETFAKYQPRVVVNLAAQAGVRSSISHPEEYMESNMMGFYQILEGIVPRFSTFPVFFCFLNQVSEG